MNPEDFQKALDIARHYFDMRGMRGIWLTRALADHIMRLYQGGERRPLMLGNRAIEDMELELENERRLSETAVAFPA